MLRSIPQNKDWSATIANLKGHNKNDLSKEKVAWVFTERATEFSKKRMDHIEASVSKMFPIHPECYRCSQYGHIKRNCKVRAQNFVKAQKLCT
jgi:hypothetical protein